MVAQAFDEVPGIRTPCRLHDLGIRRVRFAIGDVVANGAVQQGGVLRHHADLRAQAVLRHGGDVLAVDRDPAGLQIVEAQEHVHQRRLAGAGPADEADLLAGGDVERQVLDRALVLAVVEADVIEGDGTLCRRQRRRLGRILDIVRLGHHAHAVIDRADILEQRGHFPHHPLRHAVDAHGKAGGHRDGTDCHIARHPEIDADGRGEEHRDDIVDVDGDVEGRDKAHLLVHRLQELVHAFAGIGFLAAGVREQLHGRDVRVAVDDATRHHGPRIRLHARNPHELRHEVAQDADIDDEPYEQRHHEAQVRRRDDGDHRHKVAHHIDEDVDDLHHRFAHGKRGLHHLRRDAARELVGEEGHALADEIPMHLPAGDHREIARERLVHGHRVQRAEKRNEHEQKHGHPDQRTALAGEERAGIAGREPVDDIAEELEQQHFGNTERHGAEAQHGKPRRRRARVVPKEGEYSLGRKRGRLRGIGIQTSFEPAEHGFLRNRNNGTGTDGAKGRSRERVPLGVPRGDERRHTAN